MSLPGKVRSAAEVLIRSFRAGDETDFRMLNEQWISRYFKMEPKDEAALCNPQATIIGPGGAILMAEFGGRCVGCCALLRMSDGGFEVAKMAVSPEHQGSGIGRRLLGATIEVARSLGAPRLYLETNHTLATAIRLYESSGFRHLDPSQVKPSPYDRADVYMELLLR